ncbi:heme o synthase [Poriferisphaera sp. WC338]|uniref:heme o synthase n=1 Tax=Poriferisphaera sp. WC338 TaxID=3425129 RepID=UPI003D815806
MTELVTEIQSDIQQRQSVYLGDRPTGIIARRKDFIELSKVKITRMVMITAYIGYAFGPVDGITRSQWWVCLFAMLVGVALSCMSSAVFNQVMEIEPDTAMNRTQKRPLPTGRISKHEAIVFGLILGVLGLAILWIFCNWLAMALCAATIISYVLVYTPLKRVSPVALLVGAVPGAMPPVIGYAAAVGDTGGGWEAAWIVFGIMFVWQVPHFLALAWMYREDYARAGMPMLPVIDPDGSRTFQQILIGCLTLVPLGLLPTMIGVAGLFYFFAALLCGLLFMWYGIALVRKPSNQRARSLFLASLLYLPVTLLLMVVDKI